MPLYHSLFKVHFGFHFQHTKFFQKDVQDKAVSSLMLKIFLSLGLFHHCLLLNNFKLEVPAMKKKKKLSLSVLDNRSITQANTIRSPHISEL